MKITVKIILPLTAVLFLVGCGKSSMDANTPSTNNTVVNRPATDLTNVPAFPNGGTNIPASTNQ